MRAVCVKTAGSALAWQPHGISPSSGHDETDDEIGRSQGVDRGRTLLPARAGSEEGDPAGDRFRVRERDRLPHQGARLRASGGADPPAPREEFRLLLRRGPCGGLCVRVAPQVPGSADPARGRDHPQPAREPPAPGDGDRVPLSFRRRGVRLQRRHRRRRRHHPGLRGDAARLRRVAGPRLHSRRHHLRLGAQRMEAGGGLRPRWFHLDHPRQALARGDAGDKLAGSETRRREVPHRPRHGAGPARLLLYPRRRGAGFLHAVVRGIGVRRVRSRPPPGEDRRRQPDDDAGFRVAGHRRATRRGDRGSLGLRGDAGPVSQLRHDLLGHAEAAGRREGHDGESAGPHGRDRRLQFLEHEPARVPLRTVHDDVSHRGRRLHRYRAGAHHAQAARSR